MVAFIPETLHLEYRWKMVGNLRSLRSEVKISITAFSIALSKLSDKRSKRLAA
jgi:hypothetical protein